VSGARAVGTTVALIVLGTGLAFATTFLLGSIGVGRELRLALSYVALAAPLAIALRSDLARFGFRRARLGIAVASGVLLGLATLLGFGKLTVVTDGPFMGLLALAVVAFVEEGIFRGVLQAQLIAWLGRWRGLVTAVVSFTLWHIPQRLLAGVGGADLAASLVPVFALGIALGVFMLAVRNTAGPAILHTAVNWAG
jgi:membrane protease YdiL (CAAX protease family)